MEPKYKRVLLKLSGESLAGENKHGIDFDTVLRFCEPIKKLNDMGVEVAIVVGGGNFDNNWDIDHNFEEDNIAATSVINNLTELRRTLVALKETL